MNRSINESIDRSINQLINQPSVDGMEAVIIRFVCKIDTHAYPWWSRLRLSSRCLEIARPHASSDNHQIRNKSTHVHVPSGGRLRISSRCPKISGHHASSHNHQIYWQVMTLACSSGSRLRLLSRCPEIARHHYILAVIISRFAS